MKAITTFLFAAALLFAVGVNATAQNAEARVFGVELGQVIGYNFDNEEVGAGQLMGLHFGLTEDMEVGFVFISGDGPPANDMPTFRLVRMSYFVQESLAFRLSTGSAGAANDVAGGVGVVMSPFRRNMDDILTTALHLSLDYLSPNMTSGIDEGVLAVGITGKIAF
jgi:hypothetical protein